MPFHSLIIEALDEVSARSPRSEAEGGTTKLSGGGQELCREAPRQRYRRPLKRLVRRFLPFCL